MRVTLSLAAICAWLAVVPASAHHSHGNYMDTFTDVEGVVKEVHFIVPHSWVYIEVKDTSGTPQLWALEATGRQGLERIGKARRRELFTVEIGRAGARVGGPVAALHGVGAAHGQGCEQEDGGGPAQAPVRQVPSSGARAG